METFWCGPCQILIDHDPSHVDVFQDGVRILKFDIENWKVMEGKMTPKARSALESLRRGNAR